MPIKIKKKKKLNRMLNTQIPQNKKKQKRKKYKRKKKFMGSMLNFEFLKLANRQTNCENKKSKGCFVSSPCKHQKILIITQPDKHRKGKKGANSPST